MIKRLPHAVVLGGAAAAGCANTSGNTIAVCDPLITSSAVAPPGWHGTVFTIVMENHSRGEIFGNRDAPYINQLASQYAVAERYHDSYVHPSEPHAVPSLRSQADYDTSSYLKTVQNIPGIAELPCADSTDRTGVRSMTDLFAVPMGTSATGS